MSLKEYRRKRDFSRTPEPEGQDQTSDSGRLYIIHKHAARRLHYDLRLELDGVLKSWAVPKGPSLDPKERRLAVQVEDHPIEYGSFEGIIPENEYGGGTVMLWDRGEWRPHGDPRKAMQKGRLAFDLKGEKLQGAWALARMSGEAGEEGKNWLLIKKKDAESRPLSEGDVLDQTSSVATGRSIEQIAAERDWVWHSEPDKALEASEKEMSHASAKNAEKEQSLNPGDLPDARKAVQPETFKPELATLVTEPPEGEQWLHEIKYDGYRIVCMIRSGAVKLLTRHDKNWTDRFEAVARAVKALALKDAILDGEVVVLKPDGTTDFQALQNVLKGVATGTLVYYVFDIVHCGGYDLTSVPLIERKRFLRSLFKGAHTGPSIRYGDYIQGKGGTVFQLACRHAVEGLISKRASSRYISRRTRDWVKVKCLKRQEFVVGGFTEPGGSRKGFGALLLGYYKNKDLIFCGRVGTGFNEQTLSVLHRQLKQLEQKTSPFVNPPTGREARGVHWVAPKLVVDVEFSGWTDEELLRHPSFKGVREDKKPIEVVLEREQPPPAESEIKQIAPNMVEAEKERISEPAGYRKKGRGTKIAGVALSNPDRILYPEQGITKRQLALYYEEVSDWALPYMIERPLTLVRCPKGRQASCFFQKHLDEALPETMRGVPIRENNEEDIYIAIDDLPGLISLAQLGVLEIHPWGARDDDVERPDMMVFDLDPSPEVQWTDITQAAHLLHERLDALDLVSFVKTTGGKGLHVVVPLLRRAEWGEVKSFSKALAEDVARVEPKRYVATMSKAKRKGKIFIDYVRNSRGATSVAAYSTRARHGAPVSTPVRWDELGPDLKPDGYTIANLPARLKALKKDPWADFFTIRQSITKEMKAKLGVK